MGEKWRKRIICFVLSLVLLWPGVIPAGALELASQAVVLMDADSGQVLYEKNMHQQLYPASITKVMTALLALRELAPQQVLTVSQSAVKAVPITSSHISLQPGEQLTMEQLMFALGMESANDAANVLGEAISGSLSAFAERMTQEAHDLGAVNTHFTNANGLPDAQHYTTAYDMALITAAALKMPGFLEFFSTVDYLLPPTNLSDARVFSNKDRLLPGGQYYYEGVIMAKTGWTTAAQGTFVAAVKRGDSTLIVVALKSPLLEDKYRDTWKLMDYGFENFTRYAITGENLAAMLDVGDFTAAPGQEIAFQVPVGTDPDAVTFSLNQELDGEDDEITAVLSAVLGDTELPAPTLLLERPHPEEETEGFFPALEEELEELAVQVAEEASALPWKNIAITAATILILLWALRKARKALTRHQRRRVLRARIQQMKRRSK